MLWLKLIHVSKRSPTWYPLPGEEKKDKIFQIYSLQVNVKLNEASSRMHDELADGKFTGNQHFF